MNFLTEIIEGLKISWGGIRANKMRSGLTTLGIVIGIVTVSLMGMAISGLNRAFHQSISRIGADVLYVSRFAWVANQEWWKIRNRREITMQHALAVEKQMTHAWAVAPEADVNATMRAGDFHADGVRIVGTTDQYLATRGLALTAGRFMTPEESEAGRPVCVLGSDVAASLFPFSSPCLLYTSPSPRDRG